MVESSPSLLLLGPRLSLADWAALPEDVPGEFVDGRLVEEEVPDYVHEVLVAWLIRILWNWGEGRGVLVAGSDARFAVSPGRGRKPDITVFLAERRPPARGAVTIPPDIAVEVISDSARDERRDREEKRAEYAAFGVPRYWLVDPQLRRIDFLALRDKGYELEATSERGLVSVPGCAGLEIDLDAMWAKIDELE